LSPPRFLIDYAQRHAEPATMTDAGAGGSVRSQAWGFVRLLDGGRSVLVSYVIGDSCARVLGFHVQQGRSAVELTLLVSHRGGNCHQSLTAGSSIVALGGQLAGRTLLHAPVSNEGPREITWTVQPWALVTIHPTDDPTIMLIDMTQDTRDVNDPCWQLSRTVTRLIDGRFEITLWIGSRPMKPATACAANAVAGPFYATVHLPMPYDGEPLIDPLSGRDHQAGPTVRLADAPARFR
jgi:hypothetical protein